MKGPVLVSAAVIEDERGRILIAQRPSHHKLAGGLWEFPGGKVETGEAPRATCIREIREELGVEIEISNGRGGEGLFGLFSYVYERGTGDVILDPPIHILLAVYRATLAASVARDSKDDVIFQLNDVAAVKWATRGTRPGEKFAPADIEIVDLLWSGFGA